MKLCGHGGTAGVKEVNICFADMHVTAEGMKQYYMTYQTELKYLNIIDNVTVETNS